MRGQWIGRYCGDNKGQVVLDLDDRGDHFEGSAIAFDDDKNSVGAYAHIITKNKESPQNLEVELTPIHPHFNIELTPDQFSQNFPDISFPDTANVTLDIVDQALQFSWKTSLGSTSSGTLPRSRAEERSEYAPEPGVTTWETFRSYAVDLEPERYIFRGQSSNWRLRTSFHRTCRKDLIRFISHDIEKLHHAITGKTKHIFDLLDSRQNGAFWNLLQHHGYPTPLLDWSRSPFVAAYFAYRNRPALHQLDDRVRILMFDRKAWCENFPQMANIRMARPHFSVLEVLAIENDRATPQQALSTLTNIDDIESYINMSEYYEKTKYLRVFDLPTNVRKTVLKELRLMGITAASMFPGLDGICEEFRSRFFDEPDR